MVVARSRKFRAETCRKLASSRAKSIVKFGPDRKESQGRGDRAMDHISGIPSCDKLLPSLTHPHARSQNIETWPCIPYYLNLSSGACPASAPRTLTSPQVFGSSVCVGTKINVRGFHNHFKLDQTCSLCCRPITSSITNQVLSDTFFQGIKQLQ